ncbi:hypothetical protein GN244_ATG06380 [Phytophthora infestans]|uniref:Uncharacterized protein n=1 Tax=Phytophthora infestans TaxID=4787 RepID=A0A833SXP6_PHYIN|nr:hypothetical protein GN244_ATG06380 [Phytophthora infestans]KAF4129812.1 hypothetical protein GN958_ATG20978 [Phytophthora infestans]
MKANSKLYVSGQSSDDVFAYFEGNLGALCLRICTKMKPELAAFVYDGMHADDEIDSINIRENRARTPEKNPGEMARSSHQDDRPYDRLYCWSAVTCFGGFT